MTVYEIESGLLAKNYLKLFRRFQEIKKECKILEITEVSTAYSTQIYATLRQNGIIVGDLDILIAGTALENNLMLCTNNLKHYESIDGLDLINWTI